MINLISTNCGTLTPQFFNSAQFDGSPNILHGHIPYFHAKMCEWAYNIAQEWSWVVIIDAHSKSTLLQKIKSTLPTIEPAIWEVSQIVDDTMKDEVQNIVGCIFAEGIRIPGENTAIEYVGITDGSRRGFINAPIINGRTDFQPLEIGFIETNQSFVDGVLRPWNIIGAHEGLLARPRENSIKADIHLYQLAKYGADTPSIIRKAISFYDCVPIDISTQDIQYGSVEYGKKQVQFVYNYYGIQGTNF